MQGYKEGYLMVWDMRDDYRQSEVWNFIMLFADAVFNAFAGVF